MDNLMDSEMSAEMLEPGLLQYGDDIGEYDEGDSEDDLDGESYAFDFEDADAAERSRRYGRRRSSRNRRSSSSRRSARINAMRMRQAQLRRSRQQASRRRPPQRRPSRPSPAASTQQVRQVAEVVKSVDLDNKVLGDLVSKALAFESDRINKNQIAFATSQLLDQVGDSLITGPKPINWLSLAPLALMVADKNKPGGFAGLVREPWFWTVASAATLFVLTNEEWRAKFRDILGGNTPWTRTGGANPTAGPAIIEGSASPANTVDTTSSDEAAKTVSSSEFADLAATFLKEQADKLQANWTKAHNASLQEIRAAIDKATQQAVKDIAAAGKEAAKK